MAHHDADLATAVPVVRWHGWRPLPFALGSGEQGGQVFLVFDREGDLALLPTATVTYICYAPLNAGNPWTAAPSDAESVHVSHSEAITHQMLMRAVQELEADGWHVVGRLQAAFQGVDTEDDFWERLDCAGAAKGCDSRML